MDLTTARAVYWDFIINHCIKTGRYLRDDWCPYAMQHEVPGAIRTKDFSRYHPDQRNAVRALAVICRALPVVVK